MTFSFLHKDEYQSRIFRDSQDLLKSKSIRAREAGSKKAENSDSQTRRRPRKAFFLKQRDKATTFHALCRRVQGLSNNIDNLNAIRNATPERADMLLSKHSWNIQSYLRPSPTSSFLATLRTSLSSTLSSRSSSRHNLKDWEVLAV